jgi:hypothetical protein
VTLFPYTTLFRSEFTHIKGLLKKMAAGFRGFNAFKVVQKGIA